jgi:hypothetical protein
VLRRRHTRKLKRRVGRASRRGTKLGIVRVQGESHMSTKARIGIGLVLLAFVDLNAYVVWKYGYMGFLELVTANLATIAAVVDLGIALTLVTVWLWKDAKARGVSPFPYVALTATLGSVGPLLYLLVHGRNAALHRA